MNSSLHAATDDLKVYLPKASLAKTEKDSNENGATSSNQVDIKIDLLNNGIYYTFRSIFLNTQNFFSAETSEIRKILSFTTNDQEHSYDFFTEFNKFINKVDPNKKLYDDYSHSSDLFQSYITVTTLAPAIKMINARYKDTVLVDRNLKFTRIDNPNMYTGQMMNNSTIFRQEYKASAQFYPYMFHFLNNGGVFFVLPPPQQLTKNIDTKVFGFHGFYLVTSSRLSINFLKQDDPNGRTFTIDSVHIYSGEGQSSQIKGKSENPANCINVLSDEPASNQ